MKVQECAYCSAEATTEDHIPPRSLYLPGTRMLITVPSCESCGPGHAKDDEFFKTMVALCSHPDNLVAQSHMSGSIERCLREHSPGLRKKLSSQVRKIPQRTLGGIYLSDATALEITDVDWTRIKRVLTRIVKGLYFNGSGKKYEKCDFIIVDGESKAYQSILNGLPGLSEAIRQGTLFTFVDGEVCCGKIIIAQEDPREHLWCLSFYKKKSFMIFVIPQENTI